MNQSIAKISGGKEIHGMSEYDPLGKYVTKFGIQYHLQEAHNNFSSEDQQRLSDLGYRAAASGRDCDKARAWDHFMKCSNEYWLWQYEQQMKKKADAEAHSENVFEDSYCR